MLIPHVVQALPVLKSNLNELLSKANKGNETPLRPP